MNEISTIPDYSLATQTRRRPSSREDYFGKRRLVNLTGRLGYGGRTPGLVACDIIEMYDTGALVQVFSPIEPMPKLFTLEINGAYQRAKLRWADRLKIQLDFVSEDLNYIESL